MQVDYKQLEVWLHGKLKPLCVADPIPLSQYVIALIKKDKGEQELREICIDQLEVFLQENTAKFVEDLFAVLKSRTYVACETLKPNQSSSDNSCSKDSSGKNPCGNTSFDNVSKDRKRHLTNNNTNASNVTDTCAPKQKRKRSPETKAKKISSDSRSRSPHSPGRPINNASTTSRQHGKELESHVDSCSRGRHNNHSEESSLKTVDGHIRRNSSGSSNEEVTHSNTISSRRNKYHDSESHKYNNRERIHSRDKDEHSNRSCKSFAKSVTDYRVVDEKCRGVRSRRCRDFEERGFCVYGDRCQYDHGPNALVISSAKSAVSAIAHLTNPLLDTNTLSSNTGDLPMNIGKEASKSSTLQPQSFVAAVLSGPTDLNDLNQHIGTPLIPVYHPTPINHPDNQMLMTCCIDQSLDTGLFPQVPNPSVLYNKSNWKHPRLQNNVQPRPNNFRVFNNANTISRNIVPLPMIQNTTNKDQSEINPAPPAYEPDRPHLSMISTSESNILPSCDTSDVEHNASTPPLSYKPSPITEQISSYAVVPKASGVTDLSLDTTSRTIDPRTTLYIDRLPWKLNDADKIREHFSQFGHVINVIARYKGMVGSAVVEFSSSDEAEKAYRSPIPMFSNRFIRIYTRFPENFKHNARSMTSRFPRPKSILDRLGTRPVAGNNKINSYSWMSMTNDCIESQQVPGSIHSDHTLQRGNRSRWRLERNPTSGDALLSGDEDDDLIDENPTIDGHERNSATFIKERNKAFNQRMDKVVDNYVDLNVDQESLLFARNTDTARQFNNNSNNITVTSSPYTLSHKQEAEAILWERRKMAALRQRKEQLMLLDKSREARESVIEARKQRITKLKLLLERVMSQLENNRTSETDNGTDSKPLTLDERRKLLTEAKRLQIELESTLEAEKKDLDIRSSNRESNSKKIFTSKPLGSTTISAAALQALPSPIRLERQKQISEIQIEIDKLEANLREATHDDVKLKEGRRRIVELKRQLVDLETVRPSDMFLSQNTSGCAPGDNAAYPNRTQTKLDKRPRTLYITGIESDDVENFQNALSLNYLHTQSCTKQTNPETNQLVLEVTFCTRDFAEAAIRQFTQFHGRDLQMSFVYPALSETKAGNFIDNDAKHVSSTQIETSDQLQAITSSESLDYSAHSSSTSSTALNTMSL
ncbi:putative rrm/rnp domain [Schistosoma mansoni]|uniref:Putative rrm/rnp domain n=1 Tax=Schistosoma mansoni TaxID=6183 RepID=G4V882_SCHMA|nr:putative rrm/rnp domain [Schistosoma mansoni]|eukprot:XP_018648969.1 putative rrm/rnp domain [Schistosoma mansoni]